MLDNQKQDDVATNEDTSLRQPRAVIFFKPIIKRFVDGQQIVYMVLSEKGRSIAVFDSIRSCKHFAIRNQFEYHFAH
jgi:hypothetical protein